VSQRAFLSALVGLALGSSSTIRAQGVPRVSATETVEGRWLGAGEAVFYGVRYAAPPVGDLRWKPPAPLAPRSGVQSASEPGPACVQTDRLTMFSRSIAAVFKTEDRVRSDPLRTSEDCLFLNVWSDNLAAAGNPAKGVPVMVWIHGGSNLNGEGASEWYDGRALAKQGVVVVTINYRLGVFGFLAHPGLAAESPNHVSGNYGLLDQLEALRWVKRNIAAFGGDPTRVTVFGESAGAIDVLYLMASPAATGLFQRAIAQSGPPMGIAATEALGQVQGRLLARELGPDTAGGAVAALRKKSAAEVLAIAERLLAAGQFRPGPVVDGWLVPDAPGRVFATARQQKVPLLIGSNAREMTTLKYYLPPGERTVAGYRKWLETTAGPKAAELAALYPAQADAEVEGALIDATTDLLFTCPSRFAARANEAAGLPAYQYQFVRVLPGGESLGAYHAAEIGYVFGVKLAWLPREAVDDQLSAAMSRYWVAFATTGKPEVPGLPSWPRAAAAGDQYLELGPTITVKSGLRRATCDLLEPLYPTLWGPVR
jgi:para-nitrobenzyl esterase